MSRYGWFRPERHEVDCSGLPTGDSCLTGRTLFLDELDRLADRLDGATGAVAPARDPTATPMSSIRKVLVRGGESACNGGFEPHGLPHRDLNCPRGVLASVLLGATSPSSWTDAAALSRPVSAHPRVLRPVP